jgi:hypothetical protein
MFTLSPSQRTPALSFDSLNWVAPAPLPRDQTQSRRLHEPEHLINTIDPMTGHDIKDVTGHPSLEDGNLTVYFETEASRKLYQDMPLNHPSLHLPYHATDEDDRGG